MQVNQTNWYIEYDYKTLSILNAKDYQQRIYKQAQQFNPDLMEKIYSPEEEFQHDIPDWMVEVAQSLQEILELLFNFYNVQFKLSKIVEVKSKFRIICSVLKIENRYCRFFFVLSLQFRVSRILASTLRLNRFIRSILEQLRSLKKHMDQTLLDNLDQVYTFMQQRIMQTLKLTTSQPTAREINLILLDCISIVMRNAGDPTMKGILDINKQTQIIDNILRSNQINDQFMKEKMIQRKIFQENRYFQIQGLMEEDPSNKRQDLQGELQGSEMDSFQR